MKEEMEVQKIIITGGATRIGAAIAEGLANDKNQITIHYNKSIKRAKQLRNILEKKGSKIFLIKANLNNISELNRIIKFANVKMKGINCLINNASLFENDSVKNFSIKVWNKHLNINLRAPAILIKQFSKLVPKSIKANIINIIDQRVFRLTPFFLSYTLSKTGLYTLTKTSAMSLAPNIRVNGIAPGPTIKNKRQSTKHFKKQYLSTLLRKSVDAKEICSAVKFLITNKSITGQVIAIDSGQNLNWKTPNIFENKE
jgi:NAD(P)-dependent dehydrogenase (short-subunit alcohol dehydrogenase family)